MKRLRWLALLLVSGSAANIRAAEVDTVYVHSRSMSKEIPVVVVTPSDNHSNLPVVYLLHGFSDRYNGGWINRIEGIADYADRYGCMLVMPDGGFSSWYFDSPVDSTCRYETFISDELVGYIDSNYPTDARRQGRAITGNSMGGHGALYLSISHPDVFGAAGSMSGGVNIIPFADSFDISKRLGSYDEYPQRWHDHCVMDMVDTKSESMPEALIMDCGTEDFFYNENCRFHEKLLSLHVPHEFVTRPGAHNWSYWNIAIASQMLFFDRYFRAGRPK